MKYYDIFFLFVCYSFLLLVVDTLSVVLVLSCNEFRSAYFLSTFLSVCR